MLSLDHNPGGVVYKVAFAAPTTRTYKTYYKVRRGTGLGLLIRSRLAATPVVPALRWIRFDWIAEGSSVPFDIWHSQKKQQNLEKMEVEKPSVSASPENAVSVHTTTRKRGRTRSWFCSPPSNYHHDDDRRCSRRWSA